MLSIRSGHIILVVIFLLSLACKQDPKPLPPEAKQEIIPLIHHEAYIVTVDNLRMRDRAGKQSKVIRKLPEGTIVLSEGVVSDFTDKVTLRGISYDEPYHQVYLRNKEDRPGWLYGGALLKIYHDQTAYPFSTYMDGLVTGIVNQEMTSIKNVKTALLSIMEERTDVPEWNDALLRIADHTVTEASLSPAITQQIAAIEWTQDDLRQIAEGTYDYSQSAIATEVRSAGMELLATDGNVKCMVDVPHIAQLIGGPYSDEVQDYIDLQTEIISHQLYTAEARKLNPDRSAAIRNQAAAYLAAYDSRSIYHSAVQKIHDQF